MKRVLILTNVGIGLYKFRRELIEQLISNEYEVFFSCNNDEYVPKLQELGCKYIETDFGRRSRNVFGDIKLAVRYIAILKDIKPDVVLTYTIKPNIYGGLVCGFLRIPCLSNITGLGTAVAHKGFLQVITTFLYWIALGNVQWVFFQNQENLDSFKRKGIVKDKYTLLPGSGVNLSEHSPLPYEESDTTNFLFVSRILKEKGIEQYLDAAVATKKEYPETKFAIVGSCEQEYDSARMDALHQAGIITYHGMQSNVRPFYANAHCVVHPTYYPEGMSNVLLEASACARPIISTDRCGCREIINDGTNGYMIRQEDSLDLIEKVQRFLSLPFEDREQMGLAGRAKVEMEFNRQIVVDAYIEKIESCMTGRCK